MFKLPWVSLSLFALIGGFFTAATMPISPASAAVCFSTFTNKTTDNGLGINHVSGVYVDGLNVYAATNGGGLSISIDGGENFTNKTVANAGLGNDVVLGVYADGLNVYAATAGGLSISIDGGENFTNKTVANAGLGDDIVLGVYAYGLNVYAATLGGLSISIDGGENFTNKTIPHPVGQNAPYLNGVYADGSHVYAATLGGLSISAGCPPPTTARPASPGIPGIPGIFLAVNEVLVGKPVDGAPVYYGAAGIQPNSTYSLSVQSVTNSALTRKVLATGTVNSRGHLNDRFGLPALNPGTYKVVMTGSHLLGYPLVLTNHIVVDAAGKFVSVSPESQQPFLN